VGTALRYYSVTITGDRVYNGLRAKVFAHILTFSQHEFYNLNISDILSRLLSDAETIREFTGSSLSIAARNIILLIGGLGMMLHTGFMLTLMALLIIPMILIPVMTIGRKLKILSKHAQEKLSDSNSILNETLYALSTVQNFNQEKHQFQIFSKTVNTAYDTSKQRISKRALLTFCIIILVFSAVLGLLLYGSYAVKNGTMSAGEFTQFILYTVFTAGAVAALSEVLGSTYKVKAAYDRLTDILKIEPQVKNPQNPIPLDSFENIQFDNLGFQYENRTNPVLSDIHLTIKPKQKIALVGLSGSGKTTMLKLLLREVNATSGALLWNNHNVNDYDITSLRQQITYIAQNITLFSGTIVENIRFGNMNATMEQIIKAATDANLHDDIMALPNGYDSTIGERGFQLSGGQRQRLAIARGLLKDAPIWILDEPTASLDSETENKFLTTLSALTLDKTVITVTHRLTTLSKMDMIYVLEKGKIIEQGTHDALWHNTHSRYNELSRFLLNAV
jgi:ATP-binding cassette subfamily B protein